MANTYLTRTVATTGDRTKATLSVWVKKCSNAEQFIFYNYESNTTNFRIRFNPEALQVETLSGSSVVGTLTTTRKFRDVGAFYHIVVAIDSTLATADDRMKIYVNGVQETAFDARTNPPQNQNMAFNESGHIQYIGSQVTSNYFNGIMSYYYWIDGIAYPASTFGSTDSTTGEWEINTSPSVTMGTNGFTILKDGNTITDQSSNSNNFTLGGGTLTNTEDCPNNVFATMNRASPTTAAYTNMANGNLYNGDQSPNYWNSIPGTLSASSGKFYWEFKIEQVWGNTSQISQRHGIANLNVQVNQKVGSTGDVAWTDDPIAVGWQNTSGVRYSNSVTGTSDYPTYVVNDILMFAMDLDNLKLYLGKNGTWQNSGNPTSGASGTGAYTIPVAGIWTPYSETKYGSDKVSWNCGNGHFRTTAISSAGTAASTPGIFEYDVPTSYQPMSTKGLNT